jgi:hypothetical protein
MSATSSTLAACADWETSITITASNSKKRKEQLEIGLRMQDLLAGPQV